MSSKQKDPKTHLEETVPAKPMEVSEESPAITLSAPLPSGMSIGEATAELGNRKAARVMAKERARAKEEAQSEHAKHVMQIAKVREAHFQKLIVKTPLVSVEELGKKVCGVTFFEGFKVYIPFDALYCDNVLTRDANETDEQIRTRQKQLVTKALGANIQYVIKEICRGDEDGSDVLLLGDRKEALLREQRRYYFAKEGMTPYVQSKKIYDAEVIGVGANGIRVCVLGVDTQIWVYNLSYRCIDNVAEMFVPGQTIRVAVLEIKQEPGKESLSIVASAKLPEKEKLAKNLGRVMPNSLCMARITRIGKTEKNVPLISLFLEELEVPAVSSVLKTDGMTRPLKQGDLVVFRIDEIMKSGMVRGAIVRIVCDRETYIARNRI